MKPHKNIITLAEGSGGIESQELIAEYFQPFLNLKQHTEDAGIFNATGAMAVSTDAYTVSPLFFPGGDIGKLSICGSLNDIAMMGAKGAYLTCSFVIEEGFLKSHLQTILSSMAKELQKAQVSIISGDTKVVQKGTLQGMSITTTAIGEVEYHGLSASGLKAEDSIILTSYAGTHGALIYALRKGIELQSSLQSDCKQLYPIIAPLFKEIHIHALRDATRGGIAAVLNEWAHSSNIGIVIEQEKIPFQQEVLGISEFLGLDPLCLANEGAALIAVPEQYAHTALDILAHNGAKEAAIIGRAVNMHHKKVVSINKIGHLQSKQIIEYPSGEILPRIC